MPLFDRRFGKKEKEKKPIEQRPERRVPLRRSFNIGDKILNHYKVKAVLGGGMGDVYVVQDTNGYPYAVKTFKDEYLRNEEAINRFMREAETWVDLERHTNIVFANFVQKIPREYGKPYIFLEFIYGDKRYGLDLRAYIGHLDIPQALDFAIQFCTGMCYAIEKFPDMVHRDIKPDNVMITEDRIAKITDFGLVKTLDESNIEIKIEKELKALCYTSTGSCFGTVPYMAPEQFVDAASVDTRADIYSFGVMLYELLTTRLPFYATNAEAYMNKHLKEIPENPKTLNHKIPDELDALVMKCLEKKFGDRYQCFKDMQEDLIAIYNELTGEVYIIKGKKEELSAGDWSNKGISYAALGLFEKAENACRTALRTNPNDATVHYNLGRLLANAKREEEAEKEYREAIRINPNDAEAHNNLGLLLVNLYRAGEAEKEYREAIRINPNYAEAHNNLGLLLQNVKRDEEAEREYRQAIRINPNLAEAHFNLGYLLQNVKRDEEAEREYRQAIRLKSNYAGAHNNLGLLLQNAKREEEAEKEYREAIRLNSNLAEAHNNLGYLLEDVKREEEAEREYRQAIRLKSNYAEAHSNLGRLLCGSGRLDEAKREAEVALKLFREQGKNQQAEILENVLSLLNF